MAANNNPASNPEWGPNRLVIPRLGVNIPLPVEVETVLIEPTGTEIKLDTPKPGQRFTIPRLGISGEFEEPTGS